MKKYIATLVAAGVLALTGCAGEAEAEPAPTVTETVTVTETATPQPVDSSVEAVPGGGAFPDDFFVGNLEDDNDDLYEYFEDEADVVEWAMTVCAMFDREGTKQDLTDALETGYDTMDVYKMETVSMDATFNYCPEHKHRWLEAGDEWTAYK